MEIYRVIKSKGFWCVGKLLTIDPDGVPVYQILSDLYCFRGWALNFARRMCIKLS